MNILEAFKAAATAEVQGSAQKQEAAPKSEPKTKTAPKTKAAPKAKSEHKDTPKTKGDAKYIIPASFKQAIEDYLTDRPDMAEKMKQQGKSIDKCCEYIYGRMLKRAQKERGGATTVGMYVDPNEIYGMAVHYYDESDEDLKKEA